MIFSWSTSVLVAAIGHRLEKQKSGLRQPALGTAADLSDSKILRRQQQEHPIASIPPPTTPILSSQTIEGPQTGL